MGVFGGLDLNVQYAALGTIFFVGFKSFNLAREGDDDGDGDDGGDDDDDGDGGARRCRWRREPRKTLKT